MGGTLEVKRLVPELDAAFLKFMGNERDGRGACFCTAWWVPTWQEWEERTAGQNRDLREDLLARDERDGYLLFDGKQPVGWCQVGPRDRLTKLVEQYELRPDPTTWAITCFEIAPAYRGKGAARTLLEGVLADLEWRGVRRVEGFPRCGRLQPGQAWTGPEGLFRAAGFVEVGRGARGPVLRRETPA